MKVSDIAAIVADIGTLCSGVGTLIAAVKASGSRKRKPNRRSRRH